jgi:hypothetical protein
MSKIYKVVSGKRRYSPFSFIFFLIFVLGLVLYNFFDSIQSRTWTFQNFIYVFIFFFFLIVIRAISSKRYRDALTVDANQISISRLKSLFIQSGTDILDKSNILKIYFGDHPAGWVETRGAKPGGNLVYIETNNGNFAYHFNLYDLPSFHKELTLYQYPISERFNEAAKMWEQNPNALRKVSTFFNACSLLILMLGLFISWILISSIPH